MEEEEYESGDKIYVEDFFDIPDDQSLNKQNNNDSDVFDIFNDDFFAIDNIKIPSHTQTKTTQAKKKTTAASQKIYINVPIDEKDEAKALGARWDGESWYYTNPKHAGKFARWTPKGTFMKYDDLTNEQKRVIDLAKQGENVFVDACIGSGKTSTIQVLCNEIPDKKILYLTYNRLLKIDAKEKILKRRVTVTNYHGFAYKRLRDKGIITGISDIIQTFLKEKPPIESNFDILIIDEYQDIDTEISELLLYIKEYNPDIQIIAVGDIKQKIYDKTTLDVMSFILDFLGPHKDVSFTKSHRISKEWGEYLSRIWDKNIVGVNKNFQHSTMPIEQIASYIAEHDPGDILCLGRREGDMAAILNELEKDYPDKFNKKTVFASIRERGDDAIAPNANSAIFTTFDGSKGLERKICIVFDYTESYWIARTDKPMARYEIMRNLFCVAASRGKQELIMVEPSGMDSLLSDKTLKRNYETNRSFDVSFNISEMFDFKYKEDIEDCFKLINLKEVRGIGDVIDVPTADELIDLSPCIGTWQEAMFFKQYNIDLQIQIEQQCRMEKGKYITIPRHASLEDKILYLTEITTGHERYTKQVKRPFIEEKQQELIKERLRTMFTGDEEVQKNCSFCFKCGNTVIECTGRCDVVLDDYTVELKFKSDLQHEDFLQLACYLFAQNRPTGLIWNVKTNQMFEVTIPDRKKFIDAVVRTITQRIVPAFVEPTQKEIEKFANSYVYSSIRFLKTKGLLTSAASSAALTKPAVSEKETDKTKEVSKISIEEASGETKELSKTSIKESSKTDTEDVSDVRSDITVSDTDANTKNTETAKAAAEMQSAVKDVEQVSVKRVHTDRMVGWQKTVRKKSPTKEKCKTAIQI